ncbi:hypothetical protein [Bradyrhizobium sp.]
MGQTEVLQKIPDLRDQTVVERWVETRREALAGSSFSEAIRSTFVGIDLEVSPQSILGPFSSPQWQRLALSAFLSDWACYSEPADRVDFSRLLYVTGTFPHGFRVWFCRLEDGEFTPVGYTGWYPIASSIFELMLEKPETITHRGFIAPLPKLELASYLYLFNASIVPQLRRGTAQSSLLMRRFCEDLGNVQKRGLVSVTVSEDGARFSRRFGMTHMGTMTVDGTAEEIYARTQSKPWT